MAYFVILFKKLHNLPFCLLKSTITLLQRLLLFFLSNFVREYVCISFFLWKVTFLEHINISFFIHIFCKKNFFGPFRSCTITDDYSTRNWHVHAGWKDTRFKPRTAHFQPGALYLFEPPHSPLKRDCLTRINLRVATHCFKALSLRIGHPSIKSWIIKGSFCKLSLNIFSVYQIFHFQRTCICPSLWFFH